MNTKWNMEKLGVQVDMAGCPNRCRHCWLGSHKNGNMTHCDFRKIAEQFKNWRDENGVGIRELGFFSWWREPDYRDDYRALWELEQELSTPGQAERFELLSIWRLARDDGYAKWAATHAPKSCQITFFGMEKNTDWAANRAGAFGDNLIATERLICAGIAPRWQMFATKRGLGDFEQFTRLIHELDLFKRCEAIGQKFEVFVNCFLPEGNGYYIDHETLEESDLAKIPQGLIDICRDSIENFGKPEYVWLEEMLHDNSTPNFSANRPCISVDARFDVYPNIAEIAPWWRLGNMKTDGVDAIIKAYRDETTPGMIANREIPISKLAQRYGVKGSKKLYDKSDLACRFMHQWGVDYMEGKQ